MEEKKPITLTINLDKHAQEILKRKTYQLRLQPQGILLYYLFNSDALLQTNALLEYAANSLLYSNLLDKFKEHIGPFWLTNRGIKRAVAFLVLQSHLAFKDPNKWSLEVSHKELLTELDNRFAFSKMTNKQLKDCFHQYYKRVGRAELRAIHIFFNFKNMF